MLHSVGLMERVGYETVTLLNLTAGFIVIDAIAMFEPVASIFIMFILLVGLVVGLHPDVIQFVWVVDLLGERV